MPRADSQAITEAFRFVSGIYQTAAQMVAACDPILGCRGFLPYVGSWRAVHLPAKHQFLAYSDRWLPRFVLRQYHEQGRNDDILTVGAVLWYPSAAIELPVCFASRLTAEGAGDEIYWVSLLQCLAPGCPADGEAHQITPADVPGVPPEVLDELRRKVTKAGLRSVAVPLLDIASPVDVEQKLLAPLLG